MISGKCSSRGDCGHLGKKVWQLGHVRWQESWRDVSRFRRNLDSGKKKISHSDE